jgi:hypothetical protein
VCVGVVDNSPGNTAGRKWFSCAQKIQPKAARKQSWSYSKVIRSSPAVDKELEMLHCIASKRKCQAKRREPKGCEFSFVKRITSN